MEYNAFGLSWNDIVRSFNKADETDFATDSECGRFIIERELEIQEGLLSSHLNKITLEQLERLSWHEVKTIQTSGGYSGFIFDFIPDFDQDVKVYVADGYGSGEVSETSLNLYGNSEDCGDFNLDDDSTELENLSFYFDLELQKWIGVLDRVITTKKRILLSYSIKKEGLVMNSLGGVLRDQTACILGNNLFSEGGDVWGIVTRYCTNADMMHSTVAKKTWIPPEFKKLKYINSIIPSGIGSTRIRRD